MDHRWLSPWWVSRGEDWSGGGLRSLRRRDLQETFSDTPCSSSFCWCSCELRWAGARAPEEASCLSAQRLLFACPQPLPSHFLAPPCLWLWLHYLKALGEASPWGPGWQGEPGL